MPWLPFFADEVDAQKLQQWLNTQKDIAFLVPDGPKRWKAVPQLRVLADGEHFLWDHAGGPLIIGDNRGAIRRVTDPATGWEGRDIPTDVTGTMSDPGLIDTTSVFRLTLHARHRPYSPAEKARFAEQGKILMAELKKRFPEAFQQGGAADKGGQRPDSKTPRFADVGVEGRIAPEDWSPRSELMGNKDFLSLSTFEWIGDHYALIGRRPSEVTRRWWASLIGWVSSHAIALDHQTGVEDGKQEPWSFWAFPSALHKLKQGMDFDANGFPLKDKIRAARLR